MPRCKILVQTGARRRVECPPFKWPALIFCRACILMSQDARVRQTSMELDYSREAWIKRSSSCSRLQLSRGAAWASMVLGLTKSARSLAPTGAGHVLCGMERDGRSANSRKLRTHELTRAALRSCSVMLLISCCESLRLRILHQRNGA